MQTPCRRSPVFRAVARMVTLLLSVASLRAQDAAELEVDHALTFDYPTPHTDWAQPYAGPRTRVLFFTNGRGTAPRHCVELMQRFDLDAEAVFWARIVDSTKEEWHGGQNGRERMLALLDQEWDLFVFFGLSPTKMSAEAQVKMLSQVIEGGKGLVLVGVEDKRLLLDERELAPPPVLGGVALGGLYSLGEGRGVQLPGIPDIPYDEGWEVAYDCYAETLGRTMLWAAGHEPEGAVDVALRPGSEHILDRAWRGKRVQLEAMASPDLRPGRYRLSGRVRRPADEPILLKGAVVEPGQCYYDVLPHLPAGDYRVDVWLHDRDNRVVTWKSTPLTVRSPRSIDSLVLDRTWAETGESIRGSVTLLGPAFQNETLRVQLRDSTRRVLARQDVAIDPQGSQFEFHVADWMPMLLTVEAAVLDTGRELCRRHTHANVVKRHRGQWNFLIWDTPKGTLAPYAEKSLAAHGVTLQLRSGTPPKYVAANNVAWVPYTTRIMARPDADVIMRPFCWNDAAAVKQHVSNLAEKYLGARERGVFVWSLGDEVDTKGSCLSAHCAEAYRRFLKSQYASLAALNDSWGATYATWDDVGLANAGDNDEAGSLQAANYSRWFDRQAFKSQNFVNLCNQYRAAYEAIDPEAKVGFEGAGRFDRGDDIDLIVRNNTFWSPYPGTADEVIRSIAPRDFPRANWMGYTKDADSLLAKFWRMVVLDMDSVWWWRWDCIGRFHGWLAPDLRPFPAVADILEDTSIMWEGLGDVLLKSRMHDDRIAILYSYPSSLSQRLEEGTTYGGYEGAHLRAISMTRELRYNFSYVTDRMLRLGEWESDRYRVLILPRAEALSDAAAEVIRAFVADGGLVIADVRTGIFDAHLKLRQRGVLDDLFGVARTGHAAAQTVAAPTFGKLKMDPSVTVTDGQPARIFDGLPSIIIKRHGDGMTMFLNFDFSSFPNLETADTSGLHAREMQKLFGSKGVWPAIQLETGGLGRGERTRNCQVARWKNGDIQLVSLFRTGGKAEKTRVHLPGKMVIYDLRQRRCLGRESSFRTTLLPNRASFFAIMPKPAAAPKVALSETTVSQGAILGVEISVPHAQGLHAYSIRVGNKSGDIAAHRRRIVVGSPAEHFPIPIAFNDPPGMYHLIARDLYTGDETNITFEVKPDVEY